MPLKKDPKGGGTNADGSLSTVYCSYCYVNGQFMNPDMTVAEMQTLVKTKLHEMGFPRWLAGLFTYKIPTLDRWKKKPEGR